MRNKLKIGMMRENAKAVKPLIIKKLPASLVR